MILSARDSLSELLASAETADDLRAADQLIAEVIATKPRQGTPEFRAKESKRVGEAQKILYAVSQEVGPIPESKNPERRERCSLDAELFAMTYFPRTFYLPLAGYQRAMFDAFQSVILHGGRTVRAVRRGGLKSTVARACVVWAAVNRHRRFPILVGATLASVAKNRKNVTDLLASSPTLVEDYPELAVLLKSKAQPHARWRLDGRILTVSSKDADGYIVLPDIESAKCDQIRIAPFSIESSGVSGLSYVDRNGATIRPDLLVFDDVQTPQSSKSPLTTATREDAITKTFCGLAGVGVEMAAIMVCTVREPDDLSCRFLERKRHPNWDGAKYPSLIKLPENLRLWEDNAALLGMGATPRHGRRLSLEHYAANAERMIEGAVVAWEHDKLPDEPSALYSLMTVRALDPEFFRSEIQQEGIVPVNSSGVQLDAATLLTRLSHVPRGIVPDTASFVVGFIDSSDQVLWGMLCAFAPDFSGAIIDFQTWPDQRRPHFYKSDLVATISGQLPDASWEEAFVHAHNQFEAQLLADLQTQSGKPRGVDLLLKDWGDGSHKPRINSQVMASPNRARMRPSKGIAVKPGRKPVHLYGGDRDRHTGSGWVERRSETPVHVQFDSNFWKSFAARRLLTTVGAPSAVTLPGDDERANRMLCEHLTAEMPHHASLDGASAIVWELLPGRDNDFFDCYVGCNVAASMIGCSLSGDRIIRVAKPRRTKTATYL